MKKCITIIESGKYKYPITHQLIKDGRKNKVLNRKIRIKIGRYHIFLPKSLCMYLMVIWLFGVFL